MRTLLFATGNPHKVKEVREMLSALYDIKSLADIGFLEEIPETAPTLEGNALLKARFIAGRYQLDCFAEDTGLEVDALGGAPGVYSARYAGEGKDPAANMTLLLHNLKSHANRKAQFRTVIALCQEGKEYLFEGIVRGAIAEIPSGEGGFGYDPVFVPEGYTQSFAQIPPEEKNRISHRGNAITKLLEFLKR